MDTTRAEAPLELWGGVECTVNRVGDRVHDQLVASGHDHRPADIDAIAGLGVRAVRYPVLWERTESSPGYHDFTWSDHRLALLCAWGLAPIVGLLHHAQQAELDAARLEADARHLRLGPDAVGLQPDRLPSYTPGCTPISTAKPVADWSSRRTG